MGRASKDKRDVYYRKAKEEGYRARSAYKLLQIHEEFNVLDPAEIRTGAVDLCAAPGSWSQVLAHHFKAIARNNTAATSSSSAISLPTPRVVAVDLQEMAPIEGVHLLQGDITSEATAQEIIRVLNAPEEDGSSTNTAATTSSVATLHDDDEQRAPFILPRASSTTASPRKADIVICDGAPDVTGMHELDEYLQHHLLLSALHITTIILRPGGCFLTKMFRGPNTPFLIAKSEIFFNQVRVVKPKSSRNASMESFLLCQGLRLPPGYVPRFLDTANTAASVCDSLTDAHAKASRQPPAPPADGSEEEQKALQDKNQVDVKGGPLRTSAFTPDAPFYRYALPTTGSSDVLQPPTRTACTLTNKVLAPFLSCGDLSGFDADMCYDRAPDATVLEPVQPPLQAPYLAATAVHGAETTSTDGVQTASTKKSRVETSL